VVQNWSCYWRGYGVGWGSGHPRLSKGGQGENVRRRFSIVGAYPLARSWRNTFYGTDSNIGLLKPWQSKPLSLLSLGWTWTGRHNDVYNMYTPGLCLVLYCYMFMGRVQSKSRVMASWWWEENFWLGRRDCSQTFRLQQASEEGVTDSDAVMAHDTHTQTTQHFPPVKPHPLLNVHIRFALSLSISGIAHTWNVYVVIRVFAICLVE